MTWINYLGWYLITGVILSAFFIVAMTGEPEFESDEQAALAGILCGMTWPLTLLLIVYMTLVRLARRIKS
jgi:formate/nitrite transporter FocA (FNT family)